MADVTIKLNSKGVQAVLHDAGKICLDLAKDAVDECGDGYAAYERKYPERTGAVVVAVTDRAMQDNLDNNTILKAVMGK